MTSKELGQEFLRIWEDQAEFNKLFRLPPTNDNETAQQVKQFVLHTESELHELLRVMNWKEHRRNQPPLNRGHMDDEIADVFKCVMTIFQICGHTPESLFKAYWHKTAVVRQRYQEEWVNSIDRPCAIIDIDMVLADYCLGICNWLMVQPDFVQHQHMLLDIIQRRGFVNAHALGITDETWKALKHQYRVTGQKRFIPAFPDARPFLEALRRRNLQIVLVTSRPIDRYPNLFTDTINWLTSNNLPFDYLWWAFDKAERVLEANLRKQVRLVVDDDSRFIAQFARLDMHCCQVDRSPDAEFHKAGPYVQVVANLKQAIEHFDDLIREQEAQSWQTTQTQSIDPTASTPAKNPGSSSPEDPSPST